MPAEAEFAALPRIALSQADADLNPVVYVADEAAQAEAGVMAGGDAFGSLPGQNAKAGG